MADPIDGVFPAPLLIERREQSKITFEPATALTVLAYYGGPAPFSLKGYVAMLDGQPVGIGGVYWLAGKPVAFSECKPEMETRLKDKARAVRLLKKNIKAYKMPVLAIATEPTSVPLLTKLGFTLTGTEAPGGPVMMWSPLGP